MTRRQPTLLDACNDRNLFAPWFKNSATWGAWFAFVATLFALPLSDEQLATFKQCTGHRF